MSFLLVHELNILDRHHDTHDHFEVALISLILFNSPKAMMATRVTKSFKLDSEPVLLWPAGPAKLVRLKGFKLSYSGAGMEYALHRDRTASVDMVEWNPNQELVTWKDLFSEPQLRPTGLQTLAQLHANFTPKTVCAWVSRNGLLGFRPSTGVVQGACHAIVFGDKVLRFTSEPLEVIRSAAQQAANVLKLWSALKKSYGIDQNGDGEIRSVVTIKEDVSDSYEYRKYRFQRSPPKNLRDWRKFALALRKEGETDAEQVDAEIGYRVFVNGERRSRQPIPKSPRGWRKLASTLLVEYIQEHMQDEIRVSLGVQEQNKDVETASVWNLKPTWNIGSALTAYYIELLMVMRRFRSCKTCGNDISHQRSSSTYCGNSSTCRSTDWHRQKAAQKKVSNVSIR